ncbi:hypothetical protein LCGC14_2024930 [marine sediment metagenome]|uniref:Phosphoadenosine phosphosulphate reductase domain-containing protein n=1 Tax=marine sediment metagenome TaxID=412755 RepID=A0A0F9EWL2_9ZZZZ
MLSFRGALRRGRPNAMESTEVTEKLKQLAEAQAQPLEVKVDMATALIKEALAIGPASLAWSGGKDSTVLLDLVRQLAPDIPVVWNNTGVEFPETWPFIKRMTQEWGLNLHVARPEPGHTFWWCVEKYGWPLFGKDIRNSTDHHVSRRLSKRKEKAADAGRLSSYCCDYLKKKPGTKIQKAMGVKVLMLGNLVAENQTRRFAWIDRGSLYYGKKRKMWVVWPLWSWRDEDIWAYHREFSLPHCKIYDMGHKRNGCWPCGMDIGIPGNHLSRLRLSHPKLYRYLMVDKGLGEELMRIKLALRDGQGDFFLQEKVARIIDQRPCYFDRMEGL